MKHNMRTPCKHCPFRSNIRGYLTKDRCVEIATSVMRGESFPCHKTTESVENDDGEELIATDDSEQCAGAEIFAAKNGTSSQMSRITERLGMKVAKLNRRAKVVSSLPEMIKVHCGEDEQEGECCEICDHGCLAPAGYAVGGGVIHGTEYVETTCSACGRFVCEACSEEVDGEIVCNQCKEDE